MKAFITWAHRGEDWSDTQASDWRRIVTTFAQLLGATGVEVVLDQWHETDAEMDWTRWGPNQVQECDFVLIAMNIPWAEGWSGKNSPTTGAGATAEADALHGLFVQDRVVFQRKVRVVLLPGRDMTTFRLTWSGQKPIGSKASPLRM